MRVLTVILLIFSTTLTLIANPRSQAPDKQLSASESQEVEQFVQIFNKRLRQTRDLSSFQAGPLVTATLARLLLDQKDSLLPLVSHNLVSLANINELSEFWIASLNLAYLSELYIYTRMSVQGVRTYELPHARQYPPNVARLMKRNPILSKWWKEYDSDSSDQVAKTIEQLWGVTRTYQRAASVMRAQFKAHPPERTVQYRKNIVYLSEYLKVVDVDTCNSEKDCAGLPLHTKTITVNIPVLTLMLARIDGQLKLLFIGKIDD
jgi:hypothetical protein